MFMRLPYTRDFLGLCEAHRAVFRDLATVAVSLCSLRRVGAKVGIMGGYWRCGVCCYRSEWIFLSRGKGERVFVLPLLWSLPSDLGACSLVCLWDSISFCVVRVNRSLLSVFLRKCWVVGPWSLRGWLREVMALPPTSFSWGYFSRGGSGKGIFFSQI